MTDKLDIQKIREIRKNHQNVKLGSVQGMKYAAYLDNLLPILMDELEQYRSLGGNHDRKTESRD